MSASGIGARRVILDASITFLSCIFCHFLENRIVFPLFSIKERHRFATITIHLFQQAAETRLILDKFAVRHRRFLGIQQEWVFAFFLAARIKTV